MLSTRSCCASSCHCAVLLAVSVAISSSSLVARYERSASSSHGATPHVQLTICHHYARGDRPSSALCGGDPSIESVSLARRCAGDRLPSPGTINCGYHLS